MRPTLLATPPAAPSGPPFTLTRFFSLASLIGILLVTGCLFWAYRGLAERNLIEHETRANADLTRAMANSMWQRYRGFVTDTGKRPRAVLLADPAQASLRADLRELVRGLQIAKIKVYNVDGLTVFSTDDKQVGESKRDNQGFQEAMQGHVGSQITYREHFDAFEGVLNNRNLIASYVPVRAGSDGPVEGVFEVYSDVTELLSQQQRAQWQVALLVLSLLATLYLFLFFLVRKADRIILGQEQQRALQEQQVRHQAYHDVLTGLPNRAYFADRLDESIARCARHSHTCALMFIDLDNFKTVNDTLGHQAGDSLLKIVSGRINTCLRASDLLFRMGGDEFTIILPEIAAPEDAAQVARRILEVVGNPVALQAHELMVGASIGIAVYPGDGENAETLLKNADAAMYSAKEAGRSTHAFYRSTMNQRAAQRLSLEGSLLTALRDKRFVLHYQPRVNARTRQVVAVEALLRWNHPTRGLLRPEDFIGVLDDIGMMPAVGEWVLRSACQQLQRWQAAGLAPLRMSVNLAPAQWLDRRFVAMVERLLAQAGVPAQAIELEFNEAPLIAHAEAAHSALAALKAMGLRLSIDDFGTGATSLACLRKFAMHSLRIDPRFVPDLAEGSRDRVVAKSIIELARSLDIAVVAKGLETEAQAALFSELQCVELQGRLICPPMAAEALQPVLAAAFAAGASGRIDQAGRVAAG